MLTLTKALPISTSFSDRDFLLRSWQCQSGTSHVTSKQCHKCATLVDFQNISLLVFVATLLCLSWQMFVATNIILWLQKFCGPLFLFFIPICIRSWQWQRSWQCQSGTSHVTSKQCHKCATLVDFQNVSLLVFVVTKLCLSWQMFVATNIILWLQKFCGNKSFVVTKIFLSWQNFCCDKHTFDTCGSSHQR